jgi:hypothetical protein
VQPGNAGVYSVLVTNSAGSTVSTFALLTLNHLPVAGPYAVATGQEIPVSISESSLLAVGSDSDGDGLNITGVTPSSTNNGSATFDGSQIIYTPPPGYTGPDLLTYTLSDDRGGSSSGNVSINVVLPALIASTTHSLAISVISGSLHASFSGVPNLTYSIDRATDLLGPWEVPYTNVTAGTNGVLDFVDPDTTPSSRRFYRLNYP